MALRLAILVPILDDWSSFSMLVYEIDRSYYSQNVTFDIIAVDDGSISEYDVAMLPNLSNDSCIQGITVIRLKLNLGHQRAIAAGLVEVSTRNDIEGVIVMDGDGEDRPENIGDLISAAHAHPGLIVLARRAKRSESATFRIGYIAYRVLSRILVGNSIYFGNFCLLPMVATRRLVHMPELWNNLPAAIMRSRLRCHDVPTDRGTRYRGRSKMNLPALIVHGLSAMAVYTDVIFVRILLASSGVACVSVMAMFAVAFIRLATRWAIPGWATTAFGDLLVILMQTLILVVATTLTLLANRGTRQVVPIMDTAVFVAGTRNILSRQSAFAGEMDL